MFYQTQNIAALITSIDRARFSVGIDSKGLWEAAVFHFQSWFTSMKFGSIFGGVKKVKTFSFFFKYLINIFGLKRPFIYFWSMEIYRNNIYIYYYPFLQNVITFSKLKYDWEEQERKKRLFEFSFSLLVYRLRFSARYLSSVGCSSPSFAMMHTVLACYVLV